MMVLWVHREITVSKMGGLLKLDSSTLAPMLKKMEAAGLLTRCRGKEDERELIVTITRKGIDLRKEAVKVPGKMASCVALDLEEAVQLKALLAKLI